MVNFLKTHFGTMLTVLCVLLLFTACSDDEEVIDPFLKTDLIGETINLGSDAVEAFDVKVITNRRDWEIASLGVVQWCNYEIIPDGENAIIRFSVAENEEATQRETEYRLTAPGCQPLKIKIVQLGTEYAILFDQSTPRKVTQEGEEFLLTVTSNVANEPTIEADMEGWVEIIEQPIVTRTFSDKIFKVTVHKNITFQNRTGHIKFVSTALKDPVVFTIIQEKASTEGMGDTKLKVKSAELIEGNVYGNQDVSKTIDGDYSTNYSSASLGSPEANRGHSIIIEYTLEQPENIGYVRLMQRSNNDKNSLFASGGVSVLKEGETTWNEEIGFVAAQMAGAAVDISVNSLQVSKVRVRIDRMTPGIDNVNVALAEFECYQYSDNTNDILEAQKFFTDETYSELKGTVTSESLKEIKTAVIYQLAKELLEGKYDKKFRFSTYHSCKSPEIVAEELTIGSRSIYDNPTGIYFTQGEPVLVFVMYKGASNTPLSLAIADYREGGKKSVISLRGGLNVITPANSGNGYIQYWTRDDAGDTDVDIHFCFGKQIGYWDVRRGDTDATWPEILERVKRSAVDIPNAMMDILGQRVHLQNTVNAFAKCAPNAIQAVVDMHDRMLDFEYLMMGLVKNNAVPANRFFGVRSWGGSPNWNGVCANYPNTEDAMLVPKVFYRKNNVWVFGHEFGHGNQVAQMKGNGWTEVTNNLYCSFAQYMMRNDPLSEGYLRLEHESFKRPGARSALAGGRINAFLNEALVAHKSYFMQVATISTDKPGVWESDPFVKLIPLWQMTMYFMAADIKPDFWPDVHWAAIHDNDKSYSPGRRYVNFMKRAIDASGLNLCGFFEGMGLLKVFDNVKVDDYTVATINITQEMVDEVKAYGEGKPLPSGGMQYISANSVEAFKSKSNVEGTFNSGITKGTDYVTVDHAIWKNVVAFETYKGKELTDICIVGTGDVTNKTTRVDYPTGATRIEAVGWDGSRTLVTGSR
jgi:hypothetical protein